MNPKDFRKEHPELFRLWVKYKYKFGSDRKPIPTKGKNYIISIVSSGQRCFSIVEYNDGWEAESENQEAKEVNTPCLEIMSYQSQDISENEFISLLINLIGLFSSYDLENQVVVCIRTNGAGRIILDTLRKEVHNHNLLQSDNISFFPTTRRSKYGKELFKTIGQGWEMNANDEKNCLDAMRTAQEQGYFSLATDKSKQMFQLTSSEELIDKEPFFYVWMMLSYIRLSTMHLFN